jgi:hypothetical protein
MHLRPEGQLTSNWRLGVKLCRPLSSSLMVKEHIVCSLVVTGSTLIVASLRQCTNALSNGKEKMLRWFKPTPLYVWRLLIQRIGNLKSMSASLVESRKEASSGSTMNVNSWPSNWLWQFSLMTPLVGRYGMAKHYSYGLVS